MKTNKKSVTTPKGKVNSRDLVQTAIMSGLGAFGGALLSTLEYTLTNEQNFNFKTIIMTTLVSGAAHLFRKFRQDENGVTVIIPKKK